MHSRVFYSAESDQTVDHVPLNDYQYQSTHTQTTCLWSVSAHTECLMLPVNLYLRLQKEFQITSVPVFLHCFVIYFYFFGLCIKPWVMTELPHNLLCIDQKVLPDHAYHAAGGLWSGERRWVVAEWNVCVHYAYEPFLQYLTNAHAKKLKT